MSINKFSLIDKNAIITGAGGLLGYEHAYALLENGANIWMLDIDQSKLDISKKLLEKSFKNRLINTTLIDITDEDQLIRFSTNLNKNKTRIDILINNAAIDYKVKKDIAKLDNSRFENFSLQSWNKELNVGLTGAFLCCKIFGHKMSLDRKGGVILNIASDLSVISPDNRLYENNNIKKDHQPVKPITYSVIKTGLIGLTRYVSTYWADYNVRCNALSPGGVYNGQDKRFVRRVQKLIPLGRMANKNEYRSSIQFLCSDASSYLTGQNIVIDGGRSVW